MKTLAIIVLLASTSFTAPPKDLQYDFDPPAFPADTHGKLFHYYMPTHDNFAANLNVMAQPYADTLEAYDTLSQSQFKQLGLELISGGIEEGVLTYEYKGNTQGFELRWYSRAFKRGEVVYLITVTVLADRWEEDSPVLIKSAKSFEIN
ncbi:MAG: hypothetical protein AAGI37_06500 [Planctomycetota bacterium]